MTTENPSVHVIPMQGIILNKDNLFKRMCKGCTLQLLLQTGKRQHLLFDNAMTRIVWRAVHLAFNIILPRCIGYKVCISHSAL